MRRYDYRREEYHKPGSAPGLIVLQTDEVLESECRATLQADVPLYHTRVPSSLDVTQDTLALMEAEIPAAARLLPAAAGIGVVAYACTSGTTVIGETGVERAIHSVMPGVAVTNPLTAAKARLNHLGAKRFGLLTPYEPDVSRAMMEHFESHGFEIAMAGSIYGVYWND